MRSDQYPPSCVTPIGRDFGGGLKIEDFVGEVIPEQDTNWPYRALVKCGGVIVISQKADTRTEAQTILKRHLKILNMLKNGVFD